MKLFIKVTDVEGVEDYELYEIDQEIVKRIVDFATNWEEYMKHRDFPNDEPPEKPKTIEELIEYMLDDISDVYISH